MGRTSDFMTVPTWGLDCWWDGGGLMLWLFVGSTGVYLLDNFCSGVRFCLLFGPYLCFISLLCLGLCVLGTVRWWIRGHSSECRTKHPGTKHPMPFFVTLDKTSRIDLPPRTKHPMQFLSPRT